MTGGCAQCGGPLGDSPSPDYCDESCQRRWTTKTVRAVPLRKADPVAQHAPPRVGLGYPGLHLSRLLRPAGRA